MKGLQIWAYSKCRSTLAFYEGLAKSFDVPVRICLVRVTEETRKGLGWDPEEFRHLEIVPVGNNYKNAINELLTYKSWHQLFGAYQRFSAIRAVILKAKELGCEVGICSESPLNMFEHLPKRMAKNIYINHFLRLKVKKVIKASSFFINFSGDTNLVLEKIGWPNHKVIPCGYISPPLEGSHFTERTEGNHDDFHICCSGIHTWHRGQDILMDALAQLKEWGLKFTATITQSGPTTQYLKNQIRAYDLPVNMPGRISMPELIQLYENCSVFVGTGREEPWGLRVNDALHCGAPLVISDGMGAKKIVNEFACGKIFNSECSHDLAWKLRILIENKCEFLSCSQRTRRASNNLLPSYASNQIAGILSSSFGGWKSEKFNIGL